MKSAFSTIGCYNWSFGEIFATAKDFGYEGFEVRAISNEIYAPKIKAFLPENRESTKARLKDANLSIPVLTSFIFLGDANATENQMLRAKEYIDVAAAMEVPYIRILADDTAAPDNEVNEELLVHNLKTLCEYAQKNNVTVLVETNGIYADSSRMKALCERVSSPALGVLWDIHHTYRYFNEAPEKSVEILGGLIRHVHVKDSVKKDGKTIYRITGYGDVPIFDAVKALKEIGYEEFVCLEWVRLSAPELEDADIAFPQFAYYIKSLFSRI